MADSGEKDYINRLLHILGYKNNIGESREAGDIAAYVKLLSAAYTIKKARKSAIDKLMNMGMPISKNQCIKNGEVNYYGLIERINEAFSMDDKLDQEKILEKFSALDHLGEEFLMAAERGNLNKVQTFIDSGFPVNHKSKRRGLTALHVAAAYGCRDVVKALMKAEDLDYLMTDKRGYLPSELAFKYGEDEALATLLGRYERKQLHNKTSQPNISD